MRKLLGTVAAAAVLAGGLQVPAQAVQDRPNVILVLTDDQDYDTLQKMPNVKALQSEGVTFDHAFISNSLCCPSRTTILTGLYSHNNGVYNNGDGDPQNGGFDGFTYNNNEARTFPLALDNSGYQTGLFGKFLNGYGGGDSVPQQGWDRWYAFAGHQDTNSFFDPIINDDGRVHEVDGYTNAIAGNAAEQWIADSVGSDDPFFAYYAPYAPHTPRTPQAKYADVKSPPARLSFKSPAFNEKDASDKPQYIRKEEPLTHAKAEAKEAEWDMQFASLVTVDDYLGRFVDALGDEADNTVIIFISDNGFAWGDHRWNQKVVPYERAIHVPFIIKAPTTTGTVDDSLVSNVDIASTVLELAGLPAMPSDGQSLVPLFTGGELAPRDGILLEHKDGEVGILHDVPTYCGIREDGWKYVRYESGFEEVYNLTADPYEMENAASKRPNVTDSLEQDALSGGCDVFWTNVA